MFRSAVALVVSLALAPAFARATPPDTLRSTADVLCTGGDKVVLQLHTVGNAGTYYITDNRWYLVMIDAASQEVQWRDHGAVVVNTVNMLGQGDEPEVSYRTGDAPPMGRSLGEWGMVSCGQADASFVRGPGGGRFGIEVSEAGVFLTLDDHRRELEISGTWDPTELAYDQFPGIDTAPTLQSLEPISSLGNSDSLALLRTLPLRTRTVFQVELRSEFGNTQMVVATRRAVASRAMAWLVNAEGLDDHRAGRPELSTMWFLASLDLDPTFDTARYNLACALALQDDAPGAVRHLQQLPHTAELRPKIAADADFDAVRTDEAFAAFLDTLP
jgi:hypothetical protein